MFRGSDIKDIRVVNNVPRVPHDPAIMQMHVSTQNQPNFQPQFSMVPPVMPLGGQVGPFGGNNQSGPFGAMSAPNAQGGQLPQGTPGMPFGQQQQSQQQQTPQQQLGGQQQQQNNQQAQPKSEFFFYFKLFLQNISAHFIFRRFFFFQFSQNKIDILIKKTMRSPTFLLRMNY